MVVEAKSNATTTQRYRPIGFVAGAVTVAAVALTLEVIGVASSPGPHFRTTRLRSCITGLKHLNSQGKRVFALRAPGRC
jgi:hypothetical protein